jgi:hypothetical protein
MHALIDIQRDVHMLSGKHDKKTAAGHVFTVDFPCFQGVPVLNRKLRSFIMSGQMLQSIQSRGCNITNVEAGRTGTPISTSGEGTSQLPSTAHVIHLGLVRHCIMDICLFPIQDLLPCYCLVYTSVWDFDWTQLGIDELWHSLLRSGACCWSWALALS